MITTAFKSTIFARRANGARYFPVIRPRVAKKDRFRAVCTYPILPSLYIGGFYRQEILKKRS